MNSFVILKKDNSSYNQIIRSTAIFGGSQVLVVFIGLIRTKIVALLLGPVGIGIIGIYQSLSDMIRSGCVLGMDTAGVKEIAEAEASGDKGLFYSTVSRFNKWFRISALLGLVVCLVFCYPISLWAFDDGGYAVYIAILSVSIFLMILATGRSTVLQGMCKIPEMAKSAVWGALLSLVVTLPVYYFWRMDGIIPALIINAAIWLLCTEYYYRKQKIKEAGISNKEAFSAGLSAFRLGIYIVVAGFIGTLAMFAVRAFITRNIDIDAAGIFQSSWVITNVYLGLILKAMGTDFFPRLSAIAGEGDKVKKLVNEQLYVVLVVASPVIVGMLLFSDFVLSLLYSSDFSSAGVILRWQLAGTFLKIVSWPVAFILLAKNRGLMFLITEVLFYAAYLLSAYLLYPHYGLEAAGIGYLIAYALYLPVIYFGGYSVSGFRWSRDVVKMIPVNLLLISASFYVSYIRNENMLWLVISIFCISLLYAFFKLKKVFSLEDLKGWFRKK